MSYYSNSYRSHNQSQSTVFWNTLKYPLKAELEFHIF